MTVAHRTICVREVCFCECRSLIAYRYSSGVCSDGCSFDPLSYGWPSSCARPLSNHGKEMVSEGPLGNRAPVELLRGLPTLLGDQNPPINHREELVGPSRKFIRSGRVEPDVVLLYHSPEF